MAQDAEREVRGLTAARAERLATFAARPGWRVVIEAPPGAPIWPQGFDPLNMALLKDGGVLHTRFLKLGNEAGSLEAVDGEADLESFTEAAGEHPLFNGMRRATIVLPTEPAVSDSAGTVTVESPGFRASFRGTAARAPQSITITLSAPPDSP